MQSRHSRSVGTGHFRPLKTEACQAGMCFLSPSVCQLFTDVTHLLLTKEENCWHTNICLPIILTSGTGETKDFTDKRQKPHTSPIQLLKERFVLQMSPPIPALNGDDQYILVALRNQFMVLFLMTFQGTDRCNGERRTNEGSLSAMQDVSDSSYISY